MKTGSIDIVYNPSNFQHQGSGFTSNLILFSDDHYTLQEGRQPKAHPTGLSTN